MIDAEQLAIKRFEDASVIWLALRRYGLKKRTYYENQQAVKRLQVFFRGHKLCDIHVGHLHAYQQARLENDGTGWLEGPGHKKGGHPWPKTAGPSLINHELSVLQLLLKAAGQWDKIKPWYKALDLPEPESPKVLSDKEEMMVFAIAEQNPDTLLFCWVAKIAVNTGCSGAELRNLRLGDIRMHERVPGFVIRKETAKNKFRARAVILNDTAWEYMEKCLNRARECGSTKPEHYLFPWRWGKSRKWDPTRPATSSWLRRACEHLQERTGLDWLTLHVFRHQHITLRLEMGEQIENVAKDVGHSSTAMTRYYNHPRQERQLASVQMIDSKARMERAKRAS